MTLRNSSRVLKMSEYESIKHNPIKEQIPETIEHYGVAILPPGPKIYPPSLTPLGRHLVGCD